MLGGRFLKIASEPPKNPPRLGKETEGIAGRSKTARGRSADRPALTARGRELIAFVVNAAALGSHADQCDLETMAAGLGLTPGALRPTIRKLVEAGYFTVEGVAEYVYPTVKALRRIDVHLSPQQARKFLRDLRRSS